jgi:hypothetical protein
MSEITAQLLEWVEHLEQNPVLAGGVAIALVAFYLLSNWKPKATRDAEGRLREIRDETHDFYRHQRPPGR